MRLFIDANILIDVIDASRPNSRSSAALFTWLIEHQNRYELFTSCDLLTTVYYLTRKHLNPQKALQKIKILNRTLTLVEFGNAEVDEAISLMEHDPKYTDLEDTIQYVIARKKQCKYILTNDQGFASEDIPLLSSDLALETLTGV